MNKSSRQIHWDKIYQGKKIEEASWHQPTPIASLSFLKQFELPKTAKIIDIGGGASLFVDHLLSLGYQDITVLDISGKAIEKAKRRLGKKAGSVEWIIADIADFQPTRKYNFWHDRATFHFLTDEQEIEHYLNIAAKSIEPNGYLVIGTFSKQGPKKCSGIEIRQYSEQSITNRLKTLFEKIKCISVDHITPSTAIQNFIFCGFRQIKTVLKNDHS